MSRVRQLSPKFWKDEDLAELSPWARLLFAGLWGLADRDGRLEDRPAWIRVEVFPYDDLEAQGLSVGAMLDELARDRKLSAGGFIVRYRANGRSYIQIRNFKQHQKVHPREVASRIPAPPENPAAGREMSRPGPAEPGKAGMSPAVPSVPSVPSGSSEPSGSSDAGVLRDAQPAGDEPPPTSATPQEARARAVEVLGLPEREEPDRLAMEREFYDLVRRVAAKENRHADDVAAEVGTWNGRRQLNPANMGLERLRNVLVDLRRMLDGQPVRGSPPAPPKAVAREQAANAGMLGGIKAFREQEAQRDRGRMGQGVAATDRLLPGPRSDAGDGGGAGSVLPGGAPPPDGRPVAPRGPDRPPRVVPDD